MERAHKMPERAVVDANVAVLALGYVWKVLTVLLIPIVWLFIGRVQKDFEAARKDRDVIHDRIDKCDDDHLTMKESKLKDELTSEKHDRMISAIVRLEKCAAKQEGVG